MKIKMPRFAMVTDKHGKTLFVGYINGQLVSTKHGLSLNDFSVLAGLPKSSVANSIKELVNKGYLLDYRKGSENYEEAK